MSAPRGLLALLALLWGCRGGDKEDNTPTDGASEGCADPLTCAPEVVLACAGEQTVVPVPEPQRCADVAVSSDAPADFPVGTTAVTFSAAGGTCETAVVVRDEAAPLLVCPDTLSLASPEGEPVAIPLDAAVALDACAPEGVLLSVAPLSAPVGTSSVVFTATDPSGNTATCTTTAEVLSLPAPTDLQVLSASLQEDGTTAVALGWQAEPSAVVVVEQAPAVDGPWTAVETAGAPMVDGLVVSGADAWFRLVRVSGERVGGATAPLRVSPILADGYHLTDIAVTGIPFATSLYGVVRAPADRSSGPHPLVVLIHGNHGNCREAGTASDFCVTQETHECTYRGYETTPNAEGMVFQAETLAAQGFVAVSISANALNCRNVYIEERAQLILAHLRQWLAWSQDPESPWYGAVDLMQVGLVGHSRGGEAVALTPSLLAAAPIAGVAVRSVFSIAPVDNEAPVVAETPFAVVLPACDGDVTTLVGRDIYDRSTRTSDGAVRSQALVVGANHNHFSTEWAYNDGYYACPAGELLSTRAQQGWLEATLGPWFLSTLGTADLRADVRAEAPTPTCVQDWAASDLDVRWSHSAGERVLIDDLTDPDAPLRNALGEANQQDGFISARTCSQGGCGPSFGHARTALDLLWGEGRGDTVEATFGLGGLDARAAQALSLRLVSANVPQNTDRAAHSFTLEVSDLAGEVASIPLSALIAVPHLYAASNPREILQTLRLPIADLAAANADLDTGALDRLTLRFDDNIQGRLRITDVELAW